MDQPVRLANFCRLCLNKISSDSRVSIFADAAVEQLLRLIELEIDATVEPEAVVCFDCVVTLEGFLQFKQQCHVNDEFVRTVPRDDKEQEPESTVEEPSPEEEPEYIEEMLDDDVEEEVFDEDDPALLEPSSSRSASSPATIDQLQVLRDYYPDYFYFEKGPRSVHYTLVYYGERFNCATFTDRYTYWKCMHRRKHNCPAQVCCSNSYQWFQRRFEHTHGELPESEGLEVFTPKQALPHLFKICRTMALRRTSRRREIQEEQRKLKRPLDIAPQREPKKKLLVLEGDSEDNASSTSEERNKMLASLSDANQQEQPLEGGQQDVREEELIVLEGDSEDETSEVHKPLENLPVDDQRELPQESTVEDGHEEELLVLEDDSNDEALNAAEEHIPLESTAEDDQQEEQTTESGAAEDVHLVASDDDGDLITYKDEDDDALADVMRKSGVYDYDGIDD